MKNFSIQLSKYAESNVSCFLQAIQEQVNCIDFLVETLKENGTISRVKLNKMLREHFNNWWLSADRILDRFDLNGWVKSEVRLEEFRKVDTEESGRYLQIKMNPDGSATVTSSYRGSKPYIMYEPVVTTDWGWTNIKGKREVQVKRKYYTWVA